MLMLLCTRGLLKGNVFITNKLEIPHLMQIVSFDTNNFKYLVPLQSSEIY